MVLCQIFINQPETRLYAINTFGNKRVKLIKIDYLYNSATGTDKYIYIESNILRLPLSNFPYFMFCSSTSRQMSNIVGGEIVWDDVNINGNLDISIKDFETFATPTAFISMIITLDIIDK